MTPDQAFANLVLFRQVTGLLFWLDGGTLLGVIRDGDFPEDDWDDIDLCCWITDIDPELVKRQAAAAGFDLYHEWPRQLAFTKDGGKVDVFFYDVAGDEAWCCVYERNVCVPNVFPAHHVLELGSVEWRGYEWSIPSDVEAYLGLKYGDWRTPVHRSEYSCYDDSANRTLRRGWRVRRIWMM